MGLIADFKRRRHLRKETEAARARLEANDRMRSESEDRQWNDDASRMTAEARRLRAQTLQTNADGSPSNMTGPRRPSSSYRGSRSEHVSDQTLFGGIHPSSPSSFNDSPSGHNSSGYSSGDSGSSSSGSSSSGGDSGGGGGDGGGGC